MSTIQQIRRQIKRAESEPCTCKMGMDVCWRCVDLADLEQTLEDAEEDAESAAILERRERES